ncbi:ubiquitin-like protein Pup [Bifidobacterium pseudolongum]|uniref:ubiquitin-like protein Pup n=1 Tax=Bifidobacterium pseudolongum TaxID=1694 RepID=UPI0035181338
MPQEHANAQESAQHHEHDEATRSVAPEANVDSLDAVLDDIESVLESNAEAYVNGFVQKGGE